jgi:tyrosyl-DNA phosphodiesterase 2
MPSELRILSWNIDGLDEVGGAKASMLRALHVALVVARHLPAVVLLQEAVPPTLELLSAKQVLGDAYEFLTPENPRMPYYVAILIHKRLARKLASKEIEFPTSKMGRQLLAATIQFEGLKCPPLVVSTAHLESTKDHAAERKRQLARSMRFLREAVRSSGAAMLAGDLNLRDDEVRAVQKELQAEAEGILDAWTYCGSPGDAKWTWDTIANDNVSAPFKCQCRFDRMFFLSPGISDHVRSAPGAKGRASSKSTSNAASPAPPSSQDGWRPISFKLVGQERVSGLGRFPSDHWGLLTAWRYNAGNGKEDRVAAQVPDAEMVNGAPETGKNQEGGSTAGGASSDDTLKGANLPGVADDEDADLKLALALSLELNGTESLEKAVNVSRHTSTSFNIRGVSDVSQATTVIDLDD